MSYDQQYTYLDDAWHAIGWGEHTQCGLVIPQGNGYGDLPDGAKAHCGPDTKIAESEVESDPAENKAKLDEPVVSKPAAKATKKG